MIKTNQKYRTNDPVRRMYSVVFKVVVVLAGARASVRRRKPRRTRFSEINPRQYLRLLEYNDNNDNIMTVRQVGNSVVDEICADGQSNAVNGIVRWGGFEDTASIAVVKLEIIP